MFWLAGLMAKPKKRYVCQACGSVSHRWQGQCADCAEWNTLVEDAPATVFSMKHDLSSGGRAVEFVELDKPGPLPVRQPTGLAEFDRALGGGLVPGSAILLGGDQGIGKSTLLLQAAARIAREGRGVVYVSGEEASGQVRMRAARLGLSDAPVKLAAATGVRDILTTLGSMDAPGLLVIDSIQTMHSDTIEGAPGTVSQVRGCAFELIRYAKENGVALVLVGHVTKDGSIAGPRVLEHMVDATLYFEGDSGGRHLVQEYFPAHVAQSVVHNGQWHKPGQEPPSQDPEQVPRTAQITEQGYPVREVSARLGSARVRAA